MLWATHVSNSSDLTHRGCIETWLLPLGQKQDVCVCACMHPCMKRYICEGACACVLAYIRGQALFLLCQPPCLFETQPLVGLELVIWAALAGQWALGVCLSPRRHEVCITMPASETVYCEGPSPDPYNCRASALPTLTLALQIHSFVRLQLQAYGRTNCELLGLSMCSVCLQNNVDLQLIFLWSSTK